MPVLLPRGVPVEAVDVVFRLIGGSVAACGLIAWRRRPDNRSGTLMTVTGFAFFVSPLLGQLDWPVARAVGMWLSDLWVLFFVLLVLTFLTGGRVRTTTDRVLAGAVTVELFVLAPLWLVFADLDANLVAVWPHQRPRRLSTSCSGSRCSPRWPARPWSWPRGGGRRPRRAGGRWRPVSPAPCACCCSRGCSWSSS